MKKILLVYDISGWIFYRHCEEIKKRLSHKYLIDMVSHNNDIYVLSEKYDLVYVLDPMPIKYPPQNKTIMGLRAEWFHTLNKNGPIGTYENGFHCASLKNKCCILHVVNKRQLELFKPIVTDKPLLLVQHGVDETCFDKSLYNNNVRDEFVVGISGRVDSPNKKGFEIVNSVCNNMGIKYITTKFRGGVKLTKKEMPSFYREMDVYICMSETEGLCNTIMEAGAMGIPVISTRSGAAEEMIEDSISGLLVERSSIGLEKALRFMVENKEKRLEMGNNFYKEIMKNWAWKVKIKEYEDMFDLYFNMRKK